MERAIPQPMKSSKHPRRGADAFPAPAGKRGRRSVPGRRQLTRPRLNPREAEEREAAKLTDRTRQVRAGQDGLSPSGKSSASAPPAVPEPEILREVPAARPARSRREGPPASAGWTLSPLEEAFFRAGDELSRAPIPRRDLFSDLDEPE